MATPEEVTALREHNAAWSGGLTARNHTPGHRARRGKRGCCDKRAFDSKVAAREVHAGAHWRVRVYACARCRRFHVTNAEKKA